MEPINLALLGGEIVIWCNNKLTEANTAIPAKIALDTPKAGFYYNVFALLKLFQAVSGKVKLDNEKLFLMQSKKPINPLNRGSSA